MVSERVEYLLDHILGPKVKILETYLKVADDSAVYLRKFVNFLLMIFRIFQEIYPSQKEKEDTKKRNLASIRRLLSNGENTKIYLKRTKVKEVN